MICEDESAIILQNIQSIFRFVVVEFRLPSTHKVLRIACLLSCVSSVSKTVVAYSIFHQSFYFIQIIRLTKK